MQGVPVGIRPALFATTVPHYILPCMATRVDTAEILWQLWEAIHNYTFMLLAITVQISQHFAENWAAELVQLFSMVRTTAYLQFFAGAYAFRGLVAFFVSHVVRGREAAQSGLSGTDELLRR